MLRQGVRYSMMLFMQSLVMAVEEQLPSLYLLAFLSSLATSPMSHLQPAWYYSLFAQPLHTQNCSSHGSSSSLSANCDEGDDIPTLSNSQNVMTALTIVLPCCEITVVEISLQFHRQIKICLQHFYYIKLDSNSVDIWCFGYAGICNGEGCSIAVSLLVGDTDSKRSNSHQCHHRHSYWLLHLHSTITWQQCCLHSYHCHVHHYRLWTLLCYTCMPPYL